MPKMIFEMRTCHNLNLRGRYLWQIYQKANWDQITDPIFKFKKRVLSQAFGAMAYNSHHYGILSNYNDTYFLQRLEIELINLYASRVVHLNDTNPTLRECVFYISQLALNDNVSPGLDRVDDDNFSSFSSFSVSSDDGSDDGSNDEYNPDDNDDSDDSDDSSSRNRKRSSKQTDSFKKVVKTSKISKGITTIDKYLSSGTFRKIFSGHYNGQTVAWKTCDVYKEREEMKMLKLEAHMYSILKECQGIIFFLFLYNIYRY